MHAFVARIWLKLVLLWNPRFWLNILIPCEDAQDEIGCRKTAKADVFVPYVISYDVGCRKTLKADVGCRKTLEVVVRP